MAKLEIPIVVDISEIESLIDEIKHLQTYKLSYGDEQSRATYMPDLVRGIIRPHLKDINDNDLGVMIEDCSFQERMNLWGDERIDKPGWIQWKEELLAEKERRK